MSFVEMVKYLLSQPQDPTEKLYVLSERISQDPLENYFGKQRARGGRNENPNLKQCLHNAAALRVQKSMALDPVPPVRKLRYMLPLEILGRTKLVSHNCGTPSTYLICLLAAKR